MSPCSHARPILSSLAAAAGLLGASPASHALEGRIVGSSFGGPVFVTAPTGDSRVFVVEVGGTIRLLKGTDVSLFLDITPLVTHEGERGLLGMAFDPDYATNGRFYVDYVDAATQATTIARFTVTPPDADVADPATRQTVIAIPQEPFPNHKGGWIGFRRGNRKNLYIAMGDGGGGYDPNNNAQNGQVLLGKLLRIDVNGHQPGYAIPPDNPFVNSATVRPEIWALGVRNPFRNSFDRGTGAFWIGDVGQDTREEIDFEPSGDPGGHNYGWRLREGRIKTPGGVGGPKAGMTDPVFDYPHTGTKSLGDCVIGGYVYRGPSIPEADGRYFFGDCVSNRVFSFTFDAATGHPLAGREDTTPLLDGSGLATLSSFGEDGQGRLYVVGENGVVVVMCPSGAAATPATALTPPGDAGRVPAAPIAAPVAGPRLHRSVADPCS